MNSFEKSLLLESIRPGAHGPFNRSADEWDAAFHYFKRQEALCFTCEAALTEGSDIPDQFAEKWRRAEQSAAVVFDCYKAKCTEISDYLASQNVKCCIIKGISQSLRYPAPGKRQLGDIDIWTDACPKRIIKLMDRRYRVKHIDNSEFTVRTGDLLNLDVHFTPGKFDNPLYNARLQNFYREERDSQMDNRCEQGFSIPSVRFDLVHLLCHMQWHAIHGGILLRQVLDYYYALLSSTAEDREKAANDIKRLGLGRFASELMWLMSDTLQLEDRYFIAAPDSRGGRRLSAEMDRTPHTIRRFKAHKTRHIAGFLLRYPAEAFWSPLARLYRFIRKTSKKYD